MEIFCYIADMVCLFEFYIEWLVHVSVVFVFDRHIIAHSVAYLFTSMKT